MYKRQLFVLLFVGIGTGRVTNEDFVTSMSRSGDPRELLHGTLYYSVVIFVVTLLWFYSPSGNPIAFVIFGCLAGGDGLADIVGRRFGGQRRFGIAGAEKSVAGSFAMFVGSFLFSLAMLAFFAMEMSYDLVALTIPLLIVSVLATIVEALTPKGLDNITVPVTVVVVLYLLSGPVALLWPYSVLPFS